MNIGVMAIFPSVRARPRLAGGFPNALHDQVLSAHEKIPKDQTIGRGNFPA